MHKMFSDKFPFKRSIVGGDSQAQLTEEQRSRLFERVMNDERMGWGVEPCGHQNGRSVSTTVPRRASRRGRIDDASSARVEERPK